VRPFFSAVCWLCLGVGCARGAEPACWLWLSADPADGVRIAEASVSPEAALLERRQAGHRVALRLRAHPGTLVVRTPGGCPIELTGDERRPGSVLERRVEALFDLGPAARVVGADTEFEVRAQPRCPEANAARVELSVTGGAPVVRATRLEGGMALSGRTAGTDELVGRPLFGIVPVSAAERRVTELSAKVRLPDGTTHQRALELAALTRASGLPNVALDHAVLLAGSGLRLAARPDGSRALLRALGELSELVPDRSGVYSVSDADGHRLEINAGRYDETPLDCGRSDCHQAITRGFAKNPMLRALAEDLGGHHALATPDCTLACHATGEPGTRDGGFSHIHGDFPEMAALPARFEQLPRALRRLGGVGCLACHGPGSIPEASARWAVLRSDVCAVCHDAPPRYGHVAALGSSRMAHADRDPRAGSDAACARCHTTWGALGEPERKPPAEALGIGITCAACHEVHPAEPAGPTRHALLRDDRVPPLFDEPTSRVLGPSRVCLGCHAPDGDTPSASAAALWAGRGGVEPLTGAEFTGASPHFAGSRGCLACHDDGPRALALGRGHAFRAPLRACTSCHPGGRGRDPSIAERARALFAALSPAAARRALPGRPVHADPLASDLATPRGRALHDVRLVLEDPAADVHNARYANALLERAASVLNPSVVSRAPSPRPSE
jgi:hypothetical protein